MTDPQERQDEGVTDMGEDLSDAEIMTEGAGPPEGVSEEFRDVTDDDLVSVGTNQTTLGEASGGIDDLDDRLDEDLTPLDDKGEGGPA